MSRVFGRFGALMAAAAKARAKASANPSSTRTSGILKPVPVSPAMRKFLGVPEISRGEAVKKVWDHIKANNLQDPADKRVIYCDEKLKSIFGGKDKVGFLEIAKLMSQHFTKVAS